VTGLFSGTVDFGEGPVTSAGNRDAYLTKYDITGTHQWALTAGDTGVNNGDAFGWAVAADNNGGVIATGEYQYSIDWGGGPLPGFFSIPRMYLASFLDQLPVPVRISSFDARVDGRDVLLTWDLWTDEISRATPSIAVAAELQVVTPMVRRPERVHRSQHASRTDLSLQTHADNVGHAGAFPGSERTIPRFSTLLAEFSQPVPRDPTINIRSVNMGAVVNLRRSGSFEDASTMASRCRNVRTIWNARDMWRAGGQRVYFYRLEGETNGAPRKMIVIRWRRSSCLKTSPS
jgi:hypothetical protein